MQLAELIITEARGRGLRHFFGLPGGGSPLDMMEAGRRLGVSFVSVAHESSAAIMAAYYGLMQNTAGLALSVKGIGAGNLAGGAVNAILNVCRFSVSVNRHQRMSCRKRWYSIVTMRNCSVPL